MSTGGDTKHQKRLVRMLSKYGDLKDTQQRCKISSVNKKGSDSESNASGKVKRPSNASRQSVYQTESNGSDEVDCGSRKTSVEPNPDVIFQNALAYSGDVPLKNLPKSEDCAKIDFFSSDNENEKGSTKPFLLINSFQSEMPPIQANFYHRKNDGFVLRWTGFKCLKNLLDTKSDRHRPIFTYWLMAIEIAILIIIISIYGIGTFGFRRKNVSDIVWHQSNSYQPATYSEPSNMWFGPSPSILIREGAIFTPCMKREKHISASIEWQRERDSQTGCCIRLDNSGCVQTLQSKCSKRTSVWVKSKSKSGPVCGQDPKYCLDGGQHHWSSNITDWPLCNSNNRTMIMSGADSHMKCKVQARPCCSGIYGKCILASKEYCKFIKGKYHLKATLCSQVNCLNDVCGLIPFEKEPNQMYRLVLSLFLHAGVIHLAITILIQYKFMAVFEETYGTRKIILLYLISGIGGNLASAIFLPDTPEIGPMGSFFGILSLLLYEIITHWQDLENPCVTFFKVGCCLPIFFILGFIFPWINNFSNIFGFIFGLLTVFLILPANHKNKSFYISLALLCFLMCSFIFLFYQNDTFEPFLKKFRYLNCIPFTDTWCTTDIGLKEIKALN